MMFDCPTCKGTGYVRYAKNESEWFEGDYVSLENPKLTVLSKENKRLRAEWQELVMRADLLCDAVFDGDSVLTVDRARVMQAVLDRLSRQNSPIDPLHEVSDNADSGPSLTHE